LNNLLQNSTAVRAASACWSSASAGNSPSICAHPSSSRSCPSRRSSKPFCHCYKLDIYNIYLAWLIYTYIRNTVIIVTTP
jgi:hypothetical protein